MEFIVRQQYTNRAGTWELLSQQGDRLEVKYVSEPNKGWRAVLSAEAQSRIIENMAHPVTRVAPPRQRSQTPIAESSLCPLAGLLLRYKVKIQAFVRAEKLSEFEDEYRLATGTELTEKQAGVVIHPEGTDKRGDEYRFIFSGTEEDKRRIERLLPSEAGVVLGGTDNLWNINYNRLLFPLLEIGFQIGTHQDIGTIRAKIPEQYSEAFERTLLGS